MSIPLIIQKLKAVGLRGRGGAEFPTWQKWLWVKQARAKKKFIVCNAAEGDPYSKKDGYLLNHYPEEIIKGIEIALKTIDNSQAFIYLRQDYYQKFRNRLIKLAKNLPIKIVKKRGGYLSGEETTLLNVIEGKEAQPRLRPPYPAQAGLWEYPTLINNLETFYFVAKIYENKYKQTRFYTLSGKIKNPGVYQLPLNWTIQKILEQTNNLPKTDFFLQVGGIMGEVILSSEMNKPLKGLGVIFVHSFQENPIKLMKGWADFFNHENCDRCTPCREGVFRIEEMIKKEKIDFKELEDIFFVLKQTSLCPFGRMVPLPFESLIKKIILRKK